MTVVFIFSFDAVFSQDAALPARFDSLILRADELRYQDYLGSVLLYDQADAIIQQRGVERYPLPWANLLLQRASAAYYNFKFAETKKYLDQSFAFIKSERLLERNKIDSLTTEARFIEALYFNDLCKYNDALRNLNEVENFIRRSAHSNRQCFRLFQVTQYQASIYELNGEYESAINQYIASIPYYDCYRDVSVYPNYVLIYRNIGKAYLQKKENRKAIEYFFRAKANLDSCRLMPEYSPRTNQPNYFRIQNHALRLYHSIAEFYFLQNDLDSAKLFYNLALPMLNDNPINSSVVYMGLSRIAQKEKDYKKAHALFLKTLDIVRKANGERHQSTSGVYRLISLLYEEQGDLENALAYLQKALSSVQGADEPELHDWNLNPSLHSVLSNKVMLAGLNQKALLLYKLYGLKHSNSFLSKARETNQLAIQLLDSTRNEFSLEKDRVILGEEAMPVYETSLLLANVVYQQTKDDQYLREFFQLIDKSKSAVLLDHLKMIQNFSGVPTEILEKERQLKFELTFLEEQLYKNEKQEVSPTSREELGNLKKEFAALHADIKKNYPQYYALKIESRINTLSEIQKQVIEKDQAIVEYFVGDSSVFILYITQKLAGISVVKSDSLVRQVTGFRNWIIDTKVHHQMDYEILLKKKSTALYNILIAPWISQIDPSITSLIIIPQGILNYLPFEVLMSDKRNNVLIDQFSVSYASSASMLFQQKLKVSNGTFLAGFNADYSHHSKLAHLAQSAGEVSSIIDVFGLGSKVFTKATADDFRKHANQFKVLHLALHSYIDDEKPLFSRLVFTHTSDDVKSDITANELYSMELNADMIVLSACETGIGQLHQGEGMMSLSRAFMYSGVPSTVMSLWKVPDDATSLLMTEFYRFLNQGQRKDVALANAKRAFVKNNPEMNRPFYWAGFVVNGKVDPVSISNVWKQWLPWIAVGLISIIIVLLWIRRKSSRTV